MKHLTIYFAIVLLLASCSKKQAPTTVLFNGECRVEVASKTSHAEILVDSVEVGHDKVVLQVPCGERYVEVRKPGFIPYAQYLQVSLESPLSVTVELDPRKALVNTALEPSLIEKVRGPKNAPNKEGVQPTAAAATGTPLEATSNSNSGEEKWTKLEDWL
jgi:hypothetical protein